MALTSRHCTRAHTGKKSSPRSWNGISSSCPRVFRPQRSATLATDEHPPPTFAAAADPPHAPSLMCRSRMLPSQSQEGTRLVGRQKQGETVKTGAGTFLRVLKCGRRNMTKNWRRWRSARRRRCLSAHKSMRFIRHTSILFCLSLSLSRSPALSFIFRTLSLSLSRSLSPGVAQARRTHAA